MSVKLTPAKAYTAAISKTPSEVFGKLAGPGQPLMNYATLDSNFTPVSGGMPLMIGDECVGGIGVGGGVGGQDSQVAQYVIDTFNQLLKEYGTETGGGVQKPERGIPGTCNDRECRDADPGGAQEL